MALDTLLVANRGEIALRIVRTARRLGLRTVAVFSDADRDAPHVGAADRAVRLGPAAASEPYLSIEAILRAAHQEGAGAVHPGYGFLAESASFAQACESAGLVFVGPSPAVIDLMGRKDRARRTAVEAGAPVLPAVEVDEEDPALLADRVSEAIGFPALVKAVAGGGGKGMRVVSGADELSSAVASAGREALAAFGNPSLIVERYLPDGRHLEVQIVGDGTGRVLHLFDRDCSVQRRRQKVVEEAPASVNSELARSRALHAAVRTGAHVSYRSLGTVEFLALGDEVFFLEMNTRIQVEHAVTEAVTGLDLVELQLRLAGGEALDLTQDEVTVAGHAIEARVYSEDPAQGFLPQAGRALLVRWPTSVRVDTALEAGQEVGTWYDPMLGKLVAHGTSRDAARRRLVDALDGTAIFGLTTNLGLLRRLVASERFARAEVNTSWLDEHVEELGTNDWRIPIVAAALYLDGQARQGSGRDPFGPDGWRLGGPSAPTRLALIADGERHELVVHGAADDENGRVAIEGAGGDVEVRGARVGDGQVIAELDGALESFSVLDVPGAVLVAYHGASYRFEVGGGGARPLAIQDDVVVAPLPGILVAVSVTAGDSVRPGEVLGVLESMKMEYPLTASLPARVARVAFGVGSRVDRGDVLFELAAGDE